MSSPDGALTLDAQRHRRCRLQPPISSGRAAGNGCSRDHQPGRRATGRPPRRRGGRSSSTMASSPRSAAPTRGLHAAVELQRTISGAQDAEPSSPAVRAGLHSGFVIANPDQLLGRNMVLAARIAAAGPGRRDPGLRAAQAYTESDPSFRSSPAASGTSRACTVSTRSSPCSGAEAEAPRLGRRAAARGEPDPTHRRRARPPRAAKRLRPRPRWRH